MTTRAFSDLYDLILPYVPAAETPFVDYHIRRVTREFCRRTTLWRRRVTITTEPGVNDYLLSPYNAADPVVDVGPPSEPLWLPAHQTSISVTLGSVTGNGQQTVGYNPATSVWTVSTEQTEWNLPSNLVTAALNVGVPEVGAFVRLTFLPIYAAGFFHAWREVAFGVDEFGAFVYTPIQQRSLFLSRLGQNAPLEFANLSTDVDANLTINSFVPNPLVFMGGTPAALHPTDTVTFVQGHAGAWPSSVFFEALVEVASVPPPTSSAELCDPYSIISVVMDGRELRAVPEDQRVPFGARPLSGTPRAWYSPSARVVHLYPTPDAAHELVVDVVCALTMTPTLPVMPEFLFVDYREIIADGVIASLKMLANKPWYDPEGATIFARRYAFSVQGLRAKLRDGNQPNISTARGPRFGR